MLQRKNFVKKTRKGNVLKVRLPQKEIALFYLSMEPQTLAWLAPNHYKEKLYMGSRLTSSLENSTSLLNDYTA